MRSLRIVVLFLLATCCFQSLSSNLQAAQKPTLADRLRDIVRNYPQSVEARAARIVLNRLRAEEDRRTQAETVAIEVRAFDALQAAGNDRVKLVALTRTGDFNNTLSKQEAETRIRLLNDGRKERLKKGARLEFDELQKQFPDHPVLGELVELQQNEIVKQGTRASKRLATAERAPLIYNQRWRRLAEVARDFPTTMAGQRAGRILRDRRDSIGPIRIQNQSTENIILRYKQPYSRWKLAVVKPGAKAALPAAIQIRVFAQTERVAIRQVLPAGAAFAYDGKSAKFEAPQSR